MCVEVLLTWGFRERARALWRLSPSLGNREKPLGSEHHGEKVGRTVRPSLSPQTPGFSEL